jgi:hypothetical protein
LGKRLDHIGLQALGTSEIQYDCFIPGLRTAQLTIEIDAGGTKLWRVIFKDDYSSARVLDCDNREIIKEFILTNSS